MKIGLNRITFLVLSLSVGLFASVESYSQGIKYYESGKYDKAFPIVLEESRKGANKAAQYRLAQMYEQGLGTKVDYKKSIYWYKKAASKYAYTAPEATKKLVKKSTETDTSFSEKLSSQVESDNTLQAGREFALGKLDTNTPETKSMVSSIVDGDFFGLTPYQTNYILPLSWSKDKPRRVSATVPASEMGGFSEYNENIEVEFQLSLKKQLSYNLFGWNEFINLAYTQKVWWQLYDESGPFRETNYQPEIFMTVPTTESLDQSIGLKAVKLGFIHESNGQEGYRSRSWNRLYATGMWQWDNLFLSTRVWYRLDEDRKPDWYYEQDPNYDAIAIQTESDGDDNPDIEDYLGYGDIKVDYLYGKSHFGLLLRNNLDFDDNKGAIEFTYSYPLFNSPNTNWYFKAFNGYGESLIDYNRNVTKVSFGFSFSDGLF